MASRACCQNGHICSIIPPYILKFIANSSEVGHETRQAAALTLNHTKSIHAARANMVAPAPPRSQHIPQGIVPDHILRTMAQSEAVDDVTRESAQRTLEHSQAVRSDRQQILKSTMEKLPQQVHLDREIYNANHSFDNNALPGKKLRSEGQHAAAGAEEAIAETYDNLGATFDFYAKVLNRNSIDDKGLTLIGSIHFGQNYGNAFWNSQQMVFGDGNAFIYNFTKALDVIGHELTHGVTENTAGLAYHNQSGALNESVSDCFGIMIKQYKLNQTSAEADWLIGEDCLLPGVKGVALRSMKAPGTAFDDPRFGKDPQPATMDGYVNSSDDEDGDNGGVHTNSGIPNHAFYLTCIGLGGHSWEKAGKIWYNTLLSPDITPEIDFKGFADITCSVAGNTFDADTQKVVHDAWVQVGVYTPDAGPPS